MFKIGESSKLSMLTVKALRFYEKEGLADRAPTASQVKNKPGVGFVNLTFPTPGSAIYFVIKPIDIGATTVCNEYTQYKQGAMT